jgi:hypothetical protein
MRLEHTSIRKKMGKLPETNYCIGRCTRADIKSNTNSGRFTVIGLTVALGDPIMGIVIFAGEELTFKQRMRQGSTIKAVSETTVDPAKHFRGKHVPALIACSPKGSITSKILQEAFQRLDVLGIYKSVPGGPIPLVLFDAHDSSAFKLPFFGMSMRNKGTNGKFALAYSMD